MCAMQQIWYGENAVNKFLLKNLTGSQIYRMEIRFISGANTLETYVLIIAGE